MRSQKKLKHLKSALNHDELAAFDSSSGGTACEDTMTDIVDKVTRSRMMSGIRSKNTKPELTVRQRLHAAGLRFRLHAEDLPGCPDLVFRNRKTVVFVHGCFWHRHENCRFAYAPKSRKAFWSKKLASNIARDKLACSQLLNMGWHVLTIWECECSNEKALNQLVKKVASAPTTSS